MERTPSGAHLPPRQGPKGASKINWLILVFAAQMVLFMTFIGSFFTMETHRQSEIHDMSRELHRLRSENRRVTKRLLSAEKRNTRLLEETQSDLAFERGQFAGRDDDGGFESAEEGDAADAVDELAPAQHHGTWANATAVGGAAVPGGLSGRCARMLRSGEWWTYEVCVGGLVRQYHEPDGKGEFEEYILGRFDPTVALSHDDGVTHFAYNRGAQCSPTDVRKRSARLTVRCVPAATLEDLHLLAVEEPTTCSYELTAEAPASLCGGLPGGPAGGAAKGKERAGETAGAGAVALAPNANAQALALPPTAGTSAIPRGPPLIHAVDVASLPVDGGHAVSEKRMAVVGAIKHSWDGYVKYAWGADELKPVSRRKNDWIGQGLTILDSLDVLWLAGLTQEWDAGVKWVGEELDLAKHRMVSFFETTIRCLGGLLTAYELGGDAALLAKATDLGERLGRAFATSSGLPYTTISLANGQHAVPSWTGGNLLLAEVGTVQLEFFSLAKHTGRAEFHDKAQHVIDVLDKEGGPLHDGGRLWPIHIRPETGKLHGSQISWGAMGDSFYEYLLKMWLLTGKRVEQYRRMYLESIKGMQQRLIFTEHGHTYLAESNNGQVIRKMDHLVCFVPGMLALGAQHLPEVREEHMSLAIALMDTCIAMYEKQRTGLAPEFVRFTGRGMEVGAAHNLLRPETAESLFYMWRFTNDAKYRQAGWKMFAAFEKHTKVTTGGYSGIKDVRQDGGGAKDDTMQTFWIAETLKYFLLLFSDDDALDLTTHVINTEAHPLKVFTWP